MASYVHAELFRSRLSSSTKFVAMPDAGFWLDTFDVTGQPRMQNNVKLGTQTWNTSTHGPGNEACLQHYPGASWKCYLAQYLLPFIKAPLFIVNSLYDPAQYGIVLGWSGCGGLEKCNATQLKFANSYRDRFVGVVQAAIKTSGASTTGLFGTACNQVRM